MLGNNADDGPASFIQLWEVIKWSKPYKNKSELPASLYSQH